ncbi:MAG: hypothetical protein HQ553_02515 [Chloroflexi bacterium]|nr:hypothetical protein [Chloroflexota bacterium]
MNKTVFRTTMLWLTVLLLTVWPHIAPATSQTVNGNFIIEDTVPPDSVTDLMVINPSEESLTLTWTAPGDDDDRGIATQYDIRYSSQPITTETDWNNANQVSNIPIPQPAGTSETMVITDTIPDTGGFFALKTSDEIPNWSGLSNCASFATSDDITGWASPRLMLDLDGKITTWLIQPNGTLMEDVYASTVNKDLVIQIPVGAQILDSSMNPLSSITLSPTLISLSPPDNYDVITVYAWWQKGSFIMPGIDVCLSYSDDMLLQSIDESNLAIAIFNESNGEWEFVNSVLNPELNTITFSISHLHRFALVSPSTPMTTPTAETTPGTTSKVTPMPTTISPTLDPFPTTEPIQPLNPNDPNLDLRNTDLVGSEASQSSSPNETNSKWSRAGWICGGLALLLATVLLVHLSVRRLKR